MVGFLLAAKDIIWGALQVIWKVLCSIPSPVYAVILIVGIGLHFWDVHRELKARDQAWETKIEKIQEKHREVVADYVVTMTARAQVWFDAWQHEKGNIKVEIQEVRREVPILVTKFSDARCIIPVGFLRGYSVAAFGKEGGPAAVPEISGRPNDEGTGTALSTVLATDIDNLGACREALAEVKAWRGWYVDQKLLCEQKGLCRPDP